MDGSLSLLLFVFPRQKPLRRAILWDVRVARVVPDVPRAVALDSRAPARVGFRPRGRGSTAGGPRLMLALTVFVRVVNGRRCRREGWGKRHPHALPAHGGRRRRCGRLRDIAAASDYFVRAVVMRWRRRWRKWHFVWRLIIIIIIIIIFQYFTAGLIRGNRR